MAAGGSPVSSLSEETFRIAEGVMFIEWDIPDFCNRCKKAVNNEIYAESPQFQMRNATWSLRIRHFFDDSHFSEYYLFRHGEMDTFHNITYLIAIQDKNGYVNLRSRVNVLIGNDQDKLFKKQYRMNDNDLLRKLQAGEVLKVVCIVLPEEDQAHSRAEKAEGTSILSDHMKDLFIKGENCDFSIRVKSKEFQVHKAILSARSPVLSAMLHHDMAEKKSGSTDIIDSEPEVFERFLLYLYSGRVENLSWNNVTHLYSLGDKYDLEHLRRECLRYIKDNICIKRFFDVIQLAVEHNDTVLLKYAENFFLNNTKKILITTEWSSLMKKNHGIGTELFLKYVEKSSPA